MKCCTAWVSSTQPKMNTGQRHGFPPMAGYWFFGTPECHLLPHEVAYLRESHFFA